MGWGPVKENNGAEVNKCSFLIINESIIWLRSITSCNIDDKLRKMMLNSNMINRNMLKIIYSNQNSYNLASQTTLQIILTIIEKY